jgi:hypothetical protein
VLARNLHFSKSDLDEMDDEDLETWMDRCIQVSELEKKAAKSV